MPMTLEDLHAAIVDGDYRFCPSSGRDKCRGCEIDEARLLRDMREVVNATPSNE